MEEEPVEGENTELEEGDEHTGGESEQAETAPASSEVAGIMGSTDEDMDLLSIIPAHKRLNSKLATKKAKKMKAQLREKKKEIKL